MIHDQFPTPPPDPNQYHPTPDPRTPSLNRLFYEYRGLVWDVKNHPLQPPLVEKAKRPYSFRIGSELPGRPHWIKEGQRDIRIGTRRYRELVEEAFDQWWDCQDWFVGQVTVHRSNPDYATMTDLATYLGFTVVKIPPRPPTFLDRLLILLYEEQPLTLRQIAVALRPDAPIRDAVNQTNTVLHRLHRQDRVIQNPDTRAYSISVDGIDRMKRYRPNPDMVTFRIDGDVVIPAVMAEDDDRGGDAVNRLRLITEKYGCFLEQQFVEGDWPAARPVSGRRSRHDPRNNGAIEATQFRAREVVAMARDLGEPPLTFEVFLARLYFPMVPGEDNAIWETTPEWPRRGKPPATPQQLLAVRNRGRHMRRLLQRLGKLNCVRSNVAGCATWLLFEPDDPRIQEYLPGTKEPSPWPH